MQRLRAAVAVTAALAIGACAQAANVEREAKLLEAKIGGKDRERAVACAPRELASAEAHLAFGRYESKHGRLLAASNHMDEARRLVAAVATKSAGRTCEGDRDGDGIPDTVDRCPDIPEDFDGEDDEDGCPDYDRDKDGIPDDRDKCPNDPEDKDGFEDGDGCPEYDNDRDGLMDKNDQCPNEPEDRDGFQDLDGCPDPDNDGDGIPDTEDRCPNQPGPRETGGCADTYKHLVFGTKQIELRQQIFFKTGTAKLEARSFGVLNELAAALKAKSTVRIRIEGHTDNHGPADKNRRLSQARADAVRKYLMARGVPARRLTAVGYGEDRPIDDNDTEEGRATNRRVELHILK